MKFLERGMKMLIISSYPPRECGLATFSIDIVNSIRSVFGKTLPVEVCALQNQQSNFRYNSEVTYTLNTSNCNKYREVAEKINDRDDIGLVCIQHEFGLFGGDYGSYILAFLWAINKPVITVFHSILPDPYPKRKIIVKKIADLSDRIIVLTKKSKQLLLDQYEYQDSKIVIIPHGNHTVLWNQKKQLKKNYSYSDRIILSTFGLMSENKSIETILYALPKIVKKHPNVLYMVIGKTHPEVIKNEGEKYRDTLMKIVQNYKLENNVLFINEYLELSQLLEYLTLSDIYLFTSKDPNQAVSGTLAYAMSCGCAAISNPIPHSSEILDNHKGLLLNKFNEPEEFQKAILRLIQNKGERIEMAKNAFSHMRKTIWENIAIQYGLLFGKLTNKSEDLRFNAPPIKLDHIKSLTTDIGMLQFSNFCEPNPESGYTLDDNARALIDMVMYYNLYQDNSVIQLAEIYMSFIEGIQRSDGWFDNYMNYNKQLTKQNLEVNLEDANGRALWSLGFVISHKLTLPTNLVQRAEKCWLKAINNLENISSPRAISYSIKGLYHYYLSYPEETIKARIIQLADELIRHFDINSDDQWQWYEAYMTYANNVLPEAVMYSFLITNNKKYKKIAEISLDFLLSQYFMKGQIKVISNRGWFKKNNERAFYGEQPIEVATTIIVLDLFYDVTRKKKYKDQLELAFSWFLGNNHLKQIMYNPQNGASYDGLEDTHININQGAESTLCFLKAQMILENYARKATISSRRLKANSTVIPNN